LRVRRGEDHPRPCAGRDRPLHLLGHVHGRGGADGFYGPVHFHLQAVDAVLRRRLGPRGRHAARYTVRPPTTVASTSRDGDSTTRSAASPAAMLPTRSCAPMTAAGVRLAMATASCSGTPACSVMTRSMPSKKVVLPAKAVRSSSMPTPSTTSYVTSPRVNRDPSGRPAPLVASLTKQSLSGPSAFHARRSSVGGRCLPSAMTSADRESDARVAS